VTFGEQGCARCEVFSTELQSIDEGLREAYTIPAKVDRAKSKGLWKRFKIKEVPTTLLFSRGKMYVYPGKEVGSEMLKFATGDLPEGMKVPKEPTWFDDLMEKVQGMLGGGSEL